MLSRRRRYQCRGTIPTRCIIYNRSRRAMQASLACPTWCRRILSRLYLCATRRTPLSLPPIGEKDGQVGLLPPKYRASGASRARRSSRPSRLKTSNSANLSRSPQEARRLGRLVKPSLQSLAQRRLQRVSSHVPTSSTTRRSTARRNIPLAEDPAGTFQGSSRSDCAAHKQRC